MLLTVVLDSLNLAELGKRYRGSGGKRDSVEKPLKCLSGNLKPKDLCLVPFRLAIALQNAGWYVRSDIVWAKPNPMPESVLDRPTRSHEYIFLLTKSQKYYYDINSTREPHVTESRLRRKAEENWGSSAQLSSMGGGERDWNHPKGRNCRSVWNISSTPFPESHYAVFPVELARRCILAGCPEGGIVLDPFLGSGTTALVAQELRRNCLEIELNSRYLDLAAKRCQQTTIWGALEYYNK